MKLSKDRIPIFISSDLYEEVKRNVKASQGEFSNVEEYVEFILREVLKEEETKQVYTPKEEKEIKKRLRSLGYM